MAGLTKCVLLLCAAVAVAALKINKSNTDFRDGLTKTLAKNLDELSSGFNLGDTEIVFHLFTRTNPTLSQPLLPSVASILTSTFSIGRRTVISIHSYGESVSGNFNAFVIPPHLEVEDVNFVAVDWSIGAGMYTEGLGNAPQVGRVIASFINILHIDFGYSPTNIKIVGHGLGGHIAGIAARNSDIPIPHIIAIDPSLHGWTYHPEKLNADDADVVEVLHATAGSIGYDYPLGDIDFYANGGSAQMGCGADSSCSHIYAYAFYAESIQSEINDGLRFIGTACDSYNDAIVLQCSGNTEVHFGGTEIKTGVSGIYIFMTNMVPPFARG